MSQETTTLQTRQVGQVHMLTIDNPVDDTNQITFQIVVYSIFIVLGVVANLKVIYIYAVYVRVPHIRWVALMMASVDLAQCLLTIPCHIILLAYALTLSNPSGVLCMVTIAVQRALFVTSGCMLAVLSYERQYKVWYPFSSRETDFARVKTNMILSFAAGFCALSTALLDGGLTQHKVNRSNGTRAASICFYENIRHNHHVAQVFRCLELVFVIAVLLFVVWANSRICLIMKLCDKAIVSDVQSTLPPTGVSRGRATERVSGAEPRQRESRLFPFERYYGIPTTLSQEVSVYEEYFIVRYSLQKRRMSVSSHSSRGCKVVEVMGPVRGTSVPSNMTRRNSGTSYMQVSTRSASLPMQNLGSGLCDLSASTSKRSSTTSKAKSSTSSDRSRTSILRGTGSPLATRHSSTPSHRVFSGPIEDSKTSMEFSRNPSFSVVPEEEEEEHTNSHPGPSSQTDSRKISSLTKVFKTMECIDENEDCKSGRADEYDSPITGITKSVQFVIESRANEAGNTSTHEETMQESVSGVDQQKTCQEDSDRNCSASRMTETHLTSFVRGEHEQAADGENKQNNAILDDDDLPGERPICHSNIQNSARSGRDMPRSIQQEEQSGTEDYREGKLKKSKLPKPRHHRLSSHIQHQIDKRRTQEKSGYPNQTQDSTLTTVSGSNNNLAEATSEKKDPKHEQRTLPRTSTIPRRLSWTCYCCPIQCCIHYSATEQLSSGHTRSLQVSKENGEDSRNKMSVKVDALSMRELSNKENNERNKASYQCHGASKRHHKNTVNRLSDPALPVDHHKHADKHLTENKISGTLVQQTEAACRQTDSNVKASEAYTNQSPRQVSWAFICRCSVCSFENNRPETRESVHSSSETVRAEDTFDARGSKSFQFHKETCKADHNLDAKEIQPQGDSLQNAHKEGKDIANLPILVDVPEAHGQLQSKPCIKRKRIKHTSKTGYKPQGSKTEQVFYSAQLNNFIILTAVNILQTEEESSHYAQHSKWINQIPLLVQNLNQNEMSEGSSPGTKNNPSTPEQRKHSNPEEETKRASPTEQDEKRLREMERERKLTHAGIQEGGGGGAGGGGRRRMVLMSDRSVPNNTSYGQASASFKSEQLSRFSKGSGVSGLLSQIDFIGCCGKSHSYHSAEGVREERMASMFPNVSSRRVLTEPSTSLDSMMTRVSERLTSGPPRLVVSGINPDESSKLTWIPLGFLSNRVSAVQEKQVQDSQTTELSAKPEAPMTKISHRPSQGRKDSEKAKNRARYVLVLVVLFAALHLLPHGIFVVYVIFQADPITPFWKAQSSFWWSLIYRSFFLSCVFNPYVYFLSDSRVKHQVERRRLLKSKPAVLEATIPSSCEPPIQSANRNTVF